MPYTFTEIPENVHTKHYLPLLHNMWRGYQAFGWDFLHQVFKKFTSEFYTLATNRLNESILAAKLVLEGKFDDPSQVLAYAFFPAVISIREDLQSGTCKLLFGESVDCSFLVVDDDTREFLFILNCHIEDGIPVDWWTVGGTDELLDRRHLKLGYKLRQFPQKIKKFTDIGLRAIDILRDIRNERTPQWTTSNYMTSVVWCSAVINQIEYTTSYGSFGGLWDGMLAASNFELPDALFCFSPWPPMIKTFTLMGRTNFILRLTGLSTEHRLYTQGENAKNIEWLITNVPELMDLVTHQVWEKIGIPRPSETVTEEYPYLTEKTDIAKKYTLTSRGQKKIKCDDLGLSWKEAASGVYLDITYETPESTPIDASRIISTGIGSETQFRKKTSG